ncbi:11782_t:CDS:2 [Funneliformis geosporum]|nr:11782_t:CDS:2 [Funneliformis geosporum]
MKSFAYISKGNLPGNKSGTIHYAAYISVDGIGFTYYQLTDEKFRKENGFWNKERDKKYYFKFIPSSYDPITSKLNENDDNNKFLLKKSGELGCVSVYFYRAKWNLIDKGFGFPILLTPKSDKIRDDYFENIAIEQQAGPSSK